MTKTREASDLINNVYSDFANNNVGIGTTNATSKLTVAGNVSISGVVTAVSASFSGNVSIAGTLTYEDVTNVDSIGLVTARSGINVTGGSINISSGGLTVSGVTTVAAGSAGAPSVSPTGDNNTGIFFPSADTIAFAEGGVEVARFDSSGRLGIGTTSASETLHVNGNARSSHFLSQGYFAGQGNLSTADARSGFTGIGPASDTIPREFMGAYAYFYGATHNTRPGDVEFGTGLNTAGSIQFRTNGNERARIDSSARFLIGTSSARTNFFNSNVSVGPLQVAGLNYNTSGASFVCSNNGNEEPVIVLGKTRGGSIGSNAIVANNDYIGTLAFQASDGNELVEAARISAFVDGTPGVDDMPGRLVFSTTADGASTPTERCRISNSGGFSVGTTANPGAGAIFATGDITAFYSSDIRLKKDIEPISEPIKKLMEISGVTYKWNEEYLKDKEVDGYFVRETEVGVIAQEVEKVLPEVVATRENGYKAVRYEKLVALLIEAVKDQQHQIDELKARLEEI